MRRLFVLTALLFALPAHAVSIEWVEVGDPGNACETQSQGCFGAVGSSSAGRKRWRTTKPSYTSPALGSLSEPQGFLDRLLAWYEVYADVNELRRVH